MMMELNAPNEKPAKLRRRRPHHHRHRAIGRGGGKGRQKIDLPFSGSWKEGRAIKGRSTNARLG